MLRRQINAVSARKSYWKNRKKNFPKDWKFFSATNLKLSNGDEVRRVLKIVSRFTLSRLHLFVLLFTASVRFEYFYFFTFYFKYTLKQRRSGMQVASAFSSLKNWIEENRKSFRVLRAEANFGRFTFVAIISIVFAHHLNTVSLKVFIENCIARKFAMYLLYILVSMTCV